MFLADMKKKLHPIASLGIRTGHELKGCAEQILMLSVGACLWV
jgi:hypothetical protein